MTRREQPTPIVQPQGVGVSEGIHATDPQHLGSKDVAQTRRHPLIQQDLTDRTCGPDPSHALQRLVQIGGGVAQVRSQCREHGVASQIGRCQQLDQRRPLAEGRDALNVHGCVPTRTMARSLASGDDAPRSGHPQMRV